MSTFDAFQSLVFDRIREKDSNTNPTRIFTLQQDSQDTAMMNPRSTKADKKPDGGGRKRPATLTPNDGPSQAGQKQKRNPEIFDLLKSRNIHAYEPQ